MKVTKILMPTDFSDCAEGALDYAVLFAMRFRAELHLLHVTVLGDELPRGGMDFPNLSELHIQQAEITCTELDRLVVKRQTADLKILQVHRRALAAGPAIAAYAAEEDIDLIVLGTHGHRGLRRLLLGSVANEVIRTAGCPVMTMRYGKETESTELMSRIVVPIDFSAESDRALEYAMELAQVYGSRIEVVHVMFPPMAAEGVPGVPLPSFSPAEVSSEIMKTLSKRVANVANPEVAVETHVLLGRPASRISDFADEQGASLIVMGSHGLSGVRRFLLGSVSEKVVGAASCPVLVLRGPDSEEDTQQAEEEVCQPSLTS